MARACFEEILSNCFHVVDEAAFAVLSEETNRGFGGLKQQFERVPSRRRGSRSAP
jgi:hypothetical protein